MRRIWSRAAKAFALLLLICLFATGTAVAESSENHPSMGPADAPVTVTLYYDFQCGYCGKTSPVLLKIVKEYGDLVRFVAVNVPGNGHAYALPSAELALTAYEEGKFWEAFELLFANQSKLAPEYLVNYGDQLGLPKKLVEKNLKEMPHKPQLKANFFKAIDMGLTSTPTVYINTHMLVGAQDPNSFRYHINLALEEKGIKSPVGPVAKPPEDPALAPTKEVPKELIYPVAVEQPNDSVLAVKVGDKAPDFLLPTTDGDQVFLSQYAGKKNLVLSFVPAAWTPVCSAQWPEYNDNEPVFEQSDAALIGISVDNLPSLYSWTGTMGALWFPVASDFYPHGNVAKAYGILRSSGVSERAIFVIDKKGIIRYIDVHDINAKPDFEVLKQELQKLD